MIPWSTFDGFNLNLQKGYDYLIPIFTMGNIIKKITKLYFLWQFKFITQYVTDFTFAVL